MAERKFKKIEDSDFIILGKTPVDPKNEDGPTITVVEGTLIEKNVVTMRGNDVGRYICQREDETNFTVLGAQRLDEKMASVNVGDYVRITLDPETTRTSGGNEMKNFTVEVEE